MLFLKQGFFEIGILSLIAVFCNEQAWAADGPRTPEEFAVRYMDAFHKKDLATLRKLRYPISVKSELQDMIDEMTEEQMTTGDAYTKYEITAAPQDMQKPSMGPDGKLYQPIPSPTNKIKFTAVTKDGSFSSSLAIGQKDGIYYEVIAEPVAGEEPVFKFGWQRFIAPASNWSVLLPNEPEPGKAVLEKSGKDAQKDADSYGVVKNTAGIKSSQHFFQCGEEGKRLHDKENKEIYRVSCITYAPETIKEWFSDVKQNLDDAIKFAVGTHPGTLIRKDQINLAGAPGWDFEIRENDGTLCLGRVYWVKDTLFELTFESKKEKSDVAGANKFLTSLDVQ